MKTKTNVKTHLDHITPRLADSAAGRGWKRNAPRVTPEDREIFDTLHKRDEELDEDLARSIVNLEPSSFARERGTRIGEDYFNNASRGVHLSLEGRADETSSERGEGAMASEYDPTLDPETVTQHMHEYFNEVTPREFLNDIRRWSPGYVEHRGWKDLYDETGEVADSVPDQWPVDNSK